MSESVVSGKTHNNSYKNFGGQRSGGPINFFRKVYYRYTTITGVYMLDSHEAWVLHFFFAVGAYYLLSYIWTFYKQMIEAGY